MNNNWPRWFKASIAQHFVTYFKHGELLIDGQKKPATQSNDRFELRFDGPDVSMKSLGEYVLGMQVSFLIVSSSNETDIYQIDTFKGAALDAFSVSIPLYKYGPGAGDTQAAIGCATLKSDINVRDLGYVSETVYKVAIDAYYVFEPIELTAVYYEALEFDTNVSIESVDEILGT